MLYSAGAVDLHSVGDFALIGGVMAGALLPDIDSPNSKIRHMIRRLLLPKSMRRAATSAAMSFGGFDHRKHFPHWPLFWLLLCPVLYAALSGMEPWPRFVIGLGAGTGAHLFCDLLNPFGIMVLAPFSRKNLNLARIGTNSIGEFIFLGLSMFMMIGFVPAIYG